MLGSWNWLGIKIIALPLAMIGKEPVVLPLVLVILQVVPGTYGRGSSAFIPDWLELYKPLSNENYNGNPHYNRNLYFLQTLLSCFSSLQKVHIKVIAVTAHDVCILWLSRCMYCICNGKKLLPIITAKCMSPGQVMNECLSDTPTVKAQKLDFQDQMRCNGPSDNW